MNRLFGTTALVLSLAVPTFAQDATSPYLPGMERGVRASDFIGKRVYVTEADTTGLSETALAQANADWNDAGEISDIMISMAGDNQARMTTSWCSREIRLRWKMRLPSTKTWCSRRPQPTKPARPTPPRLPKSRPMLRLLMRAPR